MNIAIISPSQNAYSETFIQAHKNLLKGSVYYYYGDSKNIKLEGEGSINKNSKALFYKIKRKVFKKKYSWYYDQLLKDSFKKKKIDGILAEYGPTAERYLDCIKEINIPLIVHFHGYDASKNYIIKMCENYHRIFSYASYVVVVSKKMHDDLVALGCSKDKLVLTPCGPHPDFCKIKSRFSKQQFIAVGRFVDKKAPYYLLLSFAEVLKEFPDAQLIIAGNGALWNTCKNLCIALGLEKNISLPGIINPEKFQEYLATSLAFVQHSITAEDGDSEGTPVAVLEASAAGLPVLSTFHAGIPDVIVDGETGLLVQEHDYMAMAKNIKQILKDPNWGKQLGTNGKIRIQQNFSLDRHIEMLNETINKAILANE